VGKYNGIFQLPKFRSMKVDTPVVAIHLLPDPKSVLTPFGVFSQILPGCIAAIVVYFER
jgi:O-antigen biosynthesis protein WbqP